MFNSAMRAFTKKLVPATGFEPAPFARTAGAVASTEVFLSTTPFKKFRSNQRYENGALSS